MSEMIKDFKKGDLLYIGDNKKAYWGLPQGYPYKEMGETILDGTFEFADAGAGNYGHRSTDFTIVDGRSYTIIWDGVTYQCVATFLEVEGILVCGNLRVSFPGVLVDTGEPFLFITTSTGEKFIFTKDTAATHTITVREGIIHPISSDFLPPATKTSAGTVKQAAAVANVTAAPTAEEFNALLKSLRDAGILATK